MRNYTTSFLSLILILLASISFADDKSKLQQKLEQADLQLNLQDFKGAIHKYTEVLNIDATNTGALLGRAKAKIELSDFYGAISDCGKAIAKDPTIGEIYFIRGKSHSALLRYEEALVDFGLAIKNKYDQQLVLLERGKAYSALKSYEQSLSDYTHLISLDPNNEDAYFLRGIIKIHLGKKEEGCLDLSKSGELGDESAYAKIKEFCLPE